MKPILWASFHSDNNEFTLTPVPIPVLKILDQRSQQQLSFADSEDIHDEKDYLVGAGFGTCDIYTVCKHQLFIFLLKTELYINLCLYLTKETNNYHWVQY